MKGETHMGIKHDSEQRVWLASHADSHFGVNTRAFSSKKKALTWKTELEADYRKDGYCEGPVFGDETGEGPYFTIEAVRIDSRDFINEG
jgi:hypothetical protein